MTAVSALEYYDAFERALSALTSVRGEYRRHFGCGAEPPPAGYCWFKGVVSPERHPEYAAWACDAAAALEERFVSELPRLAPKSVLDVGCGNGPLLSKLRERVPSAELCGINFQPQQVEVARRLLDGKAVDVVLANFLEHDFGRRFELVTMVESAFHMPDKAELGRRLDRVLAPGGELWLLDIVITERASSVFSALGRDQTLFNYVPFHDWQQLLGPYGIESFELTDLSPKITEFLTVSDIEVLRREYFAPRMATSFCDATRAPTESEPAALELLVQIATEYRRLSRLLRGGMLSYALMRFRKRA